MILYYSIHSSTKKAKNDRYGRIKKNIRSQCLTSERSNGIIYKTDRISGLVYDRAEMKEERSVSTLDPMTQPGAGSIKWGDIGSVSPRLPLQQSQVEVSIPTSLDAVMHFRPAVADDMDEVLAVCNAAWGGIWSGSKEMFLHRIQAFPECGIVVGEIDGRIEGYVSVQLTDDTAHYCESWNEAADSGHLTRTHKPNGIWMHGVGLAVSAKGSKLGITRGLIEYLRMWAICNHKKGCIFVTRMPGYTRHQNMPPEEYVLVKRNKKPLDPELRVLAEYGLTVVEPPHIIRNYVEGGGDPRSCGLSVVVGWLNPSMPER